jgi:hypothetical protein
MGHASPLENRGFQALSVRALWGKGLVVGTGRSRERSRAAAYRFTLALLGAFILAFVSGIFLWTQPASVVAHNAAGNVPANSLVAAVTDTPTDVSPATPTDTPAATATDTPAATATDTPAATATDTPAATATASPTATVTATPTAASTSPYALDVSGAAAAAGWPQQFSNWCGVATIGLVANYLGSSISQSAILGILNDPSNQSQWSYPPPSSAYWGPYIPTDISGDFGTDPRSLAKGMTVATGRLYHVKMDANGAWDTTIHIVHDMLTARQPISVFVDHGMHSVIVSGVEATGDPLSDPNSITAIHVWDPGGGVNSVGIQSTQHAVVPIGAWLSGTIAWSGSSYLKYPYASNIFQGKALDPDPAVGPYAYTAAAGNHLWIGHNVYISPLASSETVGLSPDWELNQSGTLIAGLPNAIWPNLPDGYTGSSVPMPTNPPPPPPPVKPPVIAPKTAALPPPRATPAPPATATATALPTALPTATVAPVAPTMTSQPKAACSLVTCAIAIMQSDVALQAGAWLLLLLLVMWFPGAFVVAWVRQLRAKKATMEKVDMLVALTAGDASTEGELPTAEDVAFALQDKLPAGLLASVPDDPERASSLAAPTQPSWNNVSGAPEVMREAMSGHSADTTNATCEAPSNLDTAAD